MSTNPAPVIISQKFSETDWESLFFNDLNTDFLVTNKSVWEYKWTEMIFISKK